MRDLSRSLASSNYPADIKVTVGKFHLSATYHLLRLLLALSYDQVPCG